MIRSVMSFADRFAMWSIVGAFALSAAVTLFGTRTFIWVQDLTPVFLQALVFLSIGLLLRAKWSGNTWAQRIAATLIALAWLALITLSMTTLNASMMPLVFPLQDANFVAIDAIFGFDWLAFATWVSEVPHLSSILQRVYPTHIDQLMLVLIWLALTGAFARIEEFIVQGVTCAFVTLGLFFFFPGFGPIALIGDLPTALLADLQISQAAIDHIAFLMTISAEGMSELRGDQMLGMIGFPSFHIIMALLALVSARGTWIFWLLMPVNILMIPATITQGLHHLIDVVGGLIVYFLVFAFTRRLLTRLTEGGSHVRFDAAA